MVSQEEIFTKVQAALVDALALDEEDVTPQATLQGDLGAESIDYLDIMFKLEKAFGIKIQREELFPEDVFKNAQYVQNGKVTPEGLVGLQYQLECQAETACTFDILLGSVNLTIPPA